MRSTTLLLIILLCVLPTPPVASKHLKLKKKLNHIHKDIHNATNLSVSSVSKLILSLTLKNDYLEVKVVGSDPISFCTTEI